ncbi:preprotein translocase subunit SecE [Anaerobranca gottschalkii]|uniref:Protein translocase subunit SecE n=1 Tax=Anaerobranca gottschalkii DSM 13577 TaxID=1120990 RepID=A0A1I0BJL1_9FIRM|nr:preprotein translocase subunit SecE [Anaerobranca gottschalkii]SET06835.1 preprotein translocase subunit SecE [Anaerobranca gottschalkii DSM 13577]
MGFFAKVQKFFKEVKNELKKVQWPNKKELTSYTILVIGIIVIASLLIFVIDNGFTGILNLIF